jgi:hypothetical protein
MICDFCARKSNEVRYNCNLLDRDSILWSRASKVLAYRYKTRLMGCKIGPLISAALVQQHTGILNLSVCILMRVSDQFQGFPSNATLFQ